LFTFLETLYLNMVSKVDLVFIDAIAAFSFRMGSWGWVLVGAVCGGS